jgi:hypothetical protein
MVLNAMIGPPLRLTLVLEHGEPLRGVISAEDDHVAHPFAGWVELMAAINAARTVVTPQEAIGPG